MNLIISNNISETKLPKTIDDTFPPPNIEIKIKVIIKPIKK